MGFLRGRGARWREENVGINGEIPVNQHNRQLAPRSVGSRYQRQNSYHFIINDEILELGAIQRLGRRWAWNQVYSQAKDWWTTQREKRRTLVSQELTSCGKQLTPVLIAFSHINGWIKCLERNENCVQSWKRNQILNATIVSILRPSRTSRKTEDRTRTN